MKKKKLVVLCLLAVIGIYSLWSFFGPAVKAPKEKYFYIHRGADFNSVKDSLLSLNILPNDLFFKLVSKAVKYDKRILPGRYDISNVSNVVNLVRLLRSGQQTPVRLVINKLRTRTDFAEKIGENFDTDSKAAMNFLSNNDSLASLQLDTNTVMSIIIPNSYLILWTASYKNVIRRLKTEKEMFWNSARKEKARRLELTPLQVYTLASIVEEETTQPEDKGAIASVYLNRLKKNMKLDADPTVRFAIGDFGIKRILHDHLDVNSPYNTYRNQGLPPGPICTPSIKTIDAVLNAPTTEYYFFAARSDFKGYSVFAATYEEHLKNARAYQKALDSLLASKKNIP